MAKPSKTTAARRKPPAPKPVDERDGLSVADLARGILSKDTHGTVVRIAPPLNIPREDLEWAAGEIRAVFREIERDLKRAA